MNKKVLVGLLTCVILLSGCTNPKEVNELSNNSLSASNVETEVIKSSKEKVVEKGISEDSNIKAKEKSEDKPIIQKETISKQANIKQETQTKKDTTSPVIEKEEVVSIPDVPVKKPKPQESVTEEFTKPTPPPVACEAGVDSNLPCDKILDSNYYFATFSSEQEAENQGEYYLNDVMYFGEIEITNYSVQPVYRNDHSIAYYGLNLWSNGQLIQ